MPKGKLGRFIFRRIHGRIVRIKISNFADKANSFQSMKTREIVAHSEEFGRMGKLTLEIPKKAIHTNIAVVRVPEAFRKKGIAKNLFQRAAEFSERIGRKFIHSRDIQHAAQIKIRRNFGLGHSIRAGGKYKPRTRYIADQFGAYGEQSRIVKSSTAIDILKNNSTGRQIKASTMISNINKLRKKK